MIRFLILIIITSCTTSPKNNDISIVDINSDSNTQVDIDKSKVVIGISERVPIQRAVTVIIGIIIATANVPELKRFQLN